MVDEMDDQASAYIPPTIPGYALQHRIGSGGTASVWLARQVALERFVAIKYLRPEYAEKPEYVKQFKTEAKAAAQIHHHGVARVLDTGDVDGIPYFIMEYVPGMSLATWIDHHRRMPYTQALQIVDVVAETLESILDETGLIHCDIKPGNILMDENGTIKVTDLGLARLAGASDWEPFIEGTPSYIAPEQILGEATDSRTDIYSMGLTLFHLLTGRAPFDGRDVRAVLDAQQLDYLADPIDLVPDLPVAVDWLLAKMTAKSMNRRPASWAEVRRDIRLIQQGKWPLPPFPGDDESTILLRPNHQPAARANAKPKKTIQISTTQAAQLAAPKKRKSHGGLIRLIIFLILVGGAATAVWTYWEPINQWMNSQKQKPVIRAAVEKTPDAPTVATPPEKPVEANKIQTAAIQKFDPGTDVPGAWRNPDFINAATAFNAALAAYQHSQKGGAIPVELTTNIENAAALFEKIRRNAPDSVPVTQYANQCYQLLNDIRRTQLSDENRLALDSIAPKAFHPDQAPWPTPAPSDYYQLGYAWDTLPAPLNQNDATEFVTLISALVRPSPATRGENRALHGALKFIQPLDAAEKILKADHTPPRTPVTGRIFPPGGIFMQTYPAGRYGQNVYPEIRLLTDSEDRLVAVQLIDSAPTTPLKNNPDSFMAPFQTIDFTTGKIRSENDEHLQIRHDIRRAQHSLRIETEVADFSTTPPAAQFRSALILPNEVAANLMYHLIGGEGL